MNVRCLNVGVLNETHFKIGLRLFGCAGKYTEKSTHCALVKP